MEIKYGSTRTVLLIGKYAIKLPSFYNFEFFLRGLLGNLNERKWSSFKDYDSLDCKGRLCPVLFTLWGGWFSIMPRCKELTEEEFSNLNCNEFTGNKEIFLSHKDDRIMISSGGLPVEHKISSFGKLNGEIVAIDYGN